MSDRDELIAKARELSADVTKGPWIYKAGDVLTEQGVMIAPDLYRGVQSLRDGRFIAESRTLLPALADLAESEGRRAAALAQENARLINEVGALDLAARELRHRAEVLARGIAAYRTGGYTQAQLWENEEGKAVK